MFKFINDLYFLLMPILGPIHPIKSNNVTQFLVHEGWILIMKAVGYSILHSTDWPELRPATTTRVSTAAASPACRPSAFLPAFHLTYTSLHGVYTPYSLILFCPDDDNMFKPEELTKCNLIQDDYFENGQWVGKSKDQYCIDQKA